MIHEVASNFANERTKHSERIKTKESKKRVIVAKRPLKTTISFGYNGLEIEIKYCYLETCLQWRLRCNCLAGKNEIVCEVAKDTC